jgi:hypothetical protein
VSWRKDFLDIDRRFDGYFTAIVCLTLVTVIGENNSAISDDVCDMVAAMVTGVEKINKMSVVRKADRFLLKKATYLLRLSWQSSCQVTRSILQLLAHVYMRRVQRIRSKTVDGYCIRRLAEVYEAALYFVAGRYEAAENLCKRVVANSSLQVTSKAVSEPVEGEHLHNIDDGTDVVSGVIVLYQLLMSRALGRQKETSRADVFNTELFAHHLRFVIRSVSREKAMTSYFVRQYTWRVRKTRTLYCGDLMLCYLISVRRKISTHRLEKTKRRSSEVRFNSKELRRLLVEFAVEQITQFQQVLSRDFPADHCVIAAAGRQGNVRLSMSTLRSELSVQRSNAIESPFVSKRIRAFPPTDA